MLHEVGLLHCAKTSLPAHYPKSGWLIESGTR